MSAGIDEVQYIEPYPKSKALHLHGDAIAITDDERTSSTDATRIRKVLFRPFTGVAPSMFARVFLKDRELKSKATGALQIAEPDWGAPWYIGRASYAQLEAELTRG